MTVEMCACGADVRGACLDCLNGVPDKPPQRPAPATQAWEARFDGLCSGDCGLRIYAGQSIVRMDDGTFRHEECA